MEGRILGYDCAGWGRGNFCTFSNRMDEIMAMSRANMNKQVTAMPMKKKPYGMKHGGKACRGMGAAKKGGKYKVS